MAGGFPWQGGLLGRGVSLAGGSPWQGGGVSLAGGSTRQTPPVNRMTDRCKNITLATTSLRPVKIKRVFLIAKIYSFFRVG